MADQSVPSMGFLDENFGSLTFLSNFGEEFTFFVNKGSDDFHGYDICTNKLLPLTSNYYSNTERHELRKKSRKNEPGKGINLSLLINYAV